MGCWAAKQCAKQCAFLVRFFRTTTIREHACCSQSGTDASMDVGSRAKWQAPVASRGSLRAPESLNGAKGFTSRKPLALLGALKSHTLVCRICSNYSTAPASKFQKPICRFCEQLGPPRSQPSNSKMFRQMLLLRSTLLKQARRKYNLLQELIVTALRHTSRLKVVSRSLRRNLM